MSDERGEREENEMDQIKRRSEIERAEGKERI